MIVTRVNPIPGTSPEFAILVQGSDAEAADLIDLLRGSTRKALPMSIIHTLCRTLCRGLQDALGKPATSHEPGEVA